MLASLVVTGFCPCDSRRKEVRTHFVILHHSRSAKCTFFAVAKALESLFCAYFESVWPAQKPNGVRTQKSCLILKSTVRTKTILHTHTSQLPRRSLEDALFQDMTDIHTDVNQDPEKVEGRLRDPIDLGNQLKRLLSQAEHTQEIHRWSALKRIWATGLACELLVPPLPPSPLPHPPSPIPTIFFCPFWARTKIGAERFSFFSPFFVVVDPGLFAHQNQTLRKLWSLIISQVGVQGLGFHVSGHGFWVSGTDAFDADLSPRAAVM